MDDGRRTKNVAGQWLEKLILALVNYNDYKFMDLYIVYKMDDMHIFFLG
jgi:hypothetical protein